MLSVIITMLHTCTYMYIYVCTLCTCTHTAPSLPPSYLSPPSLPPISLPPSLPPALYLTLRRSFISGGWCTLTPPAPIQQPRPLPPRGSITSPRGLHMPGEHFWLPSKWEGQGGEQRTPTEVSLELASSPDHSPPTAWPGNEASLHIDHIRLISCIIFRLLPSLFIEWRKEG